MKLLTDLVPEILEEILSYLSYYGDFVHCTETCSTLHAFYTSHTWALCLLKKYGRNKVLGKGEVYFGTIVQLRPVNSSDFQGTLESRWWEVTWCPPLDLRLPPQQWWKGVENDEYFPHGKNIKTAEIINSLVRMGTPVNHRPLHALIWAAGTGNEELVKLILQRKDITKGLQLRAFKTAVRAGHADVVRMLLTDDSKILQQHEVVDSAFRDAGELGRDRVIRLLWDTLIDTATNTVRSSRGRVLAEGNDVKAVVEKYRKAIETALLNAAVGGHIAAIKSILDLDGFLASSEAIETAIEDATVHERADVVAFFLEMGFLDLAFVAVAAEVGSTPVVELLVNAGADISLAMEAAVWYEHESLVKYLLEKGADLAKTMGVIVRDKSDYMATMRWLKYIGVKVEAFLPEESRCMDHVSL
ncbi:hypothetical protein HK102_002764 [Quaeritorhiza haematococci]|nr:hypothetical protein HK102_002764 [Quaeritorhiza haematococci]